MRKGEMLTVFCYDISNNKSRSRVSKILEKTASRVQFSVFETRLVEKAAVNISRQIEQYLDDGDSLRVYVIGGNGEHRTRIYGDGPPLENRENYWLI